MISPLDWAEKVSSTKLAEHKAAVPSMPEAQQVGATLLGIIKSFQLVYAQNVKEKGTRAACIELHKDVTALEKQTETWSKVLERYKSKERFCKIVEDVCISGAVQTAIFQYNTNDKGVQAGIKTDMGGRLLSSAFCTLNAWIGAGVSTNSYRRDQLVA